MKEPVKSV